MLNTRYPSTYSTAFFGRRRPLTYRFDEFFESVDDAKPADLFWLRDAVYEQESRGRFLVATRYGRIYVGDEHGNLVLTLNGHGREALLRNLDRTCKLACQSDPFSETIRRLLRRDD